MSSTIPMETLWGEWAGQGKETLMCMYHGPNNLLPSTFRYTNVHSGFGKAKCAEHTVGSSGDFVAFPVNT